MGVDISSYRAAIGIFNSIYLSNISPSAFQLEYIFIEFCFFNYVLPYLLVIGGVHKNPGPERVTPQVANRISRSTKQLKVCHANVNSIVSDSDVTRAPYGCHFPKLDEIALLCIQQNIDVMAITETKIDNSISDESLEMPSFQHPFRKDRVRGAGGVMVYVKDNISAKRRIDLEKPDFEVICLEVNVNRNRLLICTYYRPDHCDILDFLECFDEPRP